MSTPVEQIKERLGIADVVGSYLKLERAGSSLKARCPFHTEKTPSFFVSPARGSFYCFGCGKGGDIFTFVQEFEGLDFVGALRVLASRAGVELTRLDPKEQSRNARLYLLLEKAARFFESVLKKTPEARAYLVSRALLPETAERWRLGFAPNEWRALHDYLVADGFTGEEMEQVGLVKRSEDGGGRFYDVFRGRIVFPLQDGAGRVIAFSARILPSLDDGKTGKYLNSPETALFRKSEVLYGFDKAKFAIRKKDAAILVEGQMDLLMAHQAGSLNAVASSGTALTGEQLAKLKRLSENLLIAFDSDPAGVAASERALRLALSLGMNVRIIPLKAKDPADLIAEKGGGWEAAVQGAKHVVDFLLDEILSSSATGREQALRIERAVLPLVALLPSKIEQSHHLKAVAERSGLREAALFESMKHVSPPAGGTASRFTPPRGASFDGSKTLERRVAALFFAAEGASAAQAERVAKRLTALIGADELRQMLERHRSERDALLAEAELSYGALGASVPAEEELLARFEEETVGGALSRVMDALAEAERKGKKDAFPALLGQCKQLSEKLSGLKAARFSR